MTSIYGTATRRTRRAPLNRPYHDVPMTLRRRDVLDLIIDHDGCTAGEMMGHMGRVMNKTDLHGCLSWLVSATVIKVGKKRKCRTSGYGGVKTWWINR